MSFYFDFNLFQFEVKRMSISPIQINYYAILTALKNRPAKLEEKKDAVLPY